MRRPRRSASAPRVRSDAKNLQTAIVHSRRPTVHSAYSVHARAYRFAMSTVAARKKADAPQARGSYPPVTHIVIHSLRGVRFLSRGRDAPDGARHRGDRGITMASLAGHQVMTRTLMHPMAADAAGSNRHFQLIVDVHLLLLSDGDLLLGRRANTGYGDGAYEPPSDRLAERETLVEAAVRVAGTQVGIELDAGRVSLAHVMHDVSGHGRMAFFLTADGWDRPSEIDAARLAGAGSYSDFGWYPL